jgi:hypothetical protein
MIMTAHPRARNGRRADAAVYAQWRNGEDHAERVQVKVARPDQRPHRPQAVAFVHSPEVSPDAMAFAAATGNTGVVVKS